jgi:hypothetical protein
LPANFSAHTASPRPPSRVPAGSRASSRPTSIAPRTTSARGRPAWGAPRTRTHRSIPAPPRPEGVLRLLVLDRVTMQVFVRENCTMIAAPVQCDVDGIPKGSHYVLLDGLTSAFCRAALSAKRRGKGVGRRRAVRWHRQRTKRKTPVPPHRWPNPAKYAEGRVWPLSSRGAALAKIDPPPSTSPRGKFANKTFSATKFLDCRI